MGALADTLTLNRALIQKLRDDYGYVDGLTPDMKWPVDTAARQPLQLPSMGDGDLVKNNMRSGGHDES